MRRFWIIGMLVALTTPMTSWSHDILATEHDSSHEEQTQAMIDAMALSKGEDPFRQLNEVLPTPDNRRLASGMPGPDYWQNEADHIIDVTLDPAAGRLIGKERITYHNNSPHTLSYLWLQLDANRFKEESLAKRSRGGPDLSQSQDIGFLERLHAYETFEPGSNISRVVDGSSRALPYTVVDTMMRIDLPRPIKPGGTFVFSVDWDHMVTPETVGGRSQVEILDDGTPLYELAQWFPRMAAYTDVDGWQNKPFLGRGEFTLEFGDYTLNITVPDTYIVTATGELKNPGAVLNTTHRKRLKQAKTADTPVLIITREEADANRKREATSTKTWKFRADNVRDVAWAASPAFLWDAWGVDVPGSNRNTMAMSLWPSEGEPLWSRYSTHAVAHTIEVYSELSIPYPYPVAISVNGPVGGMEYPMICFNGPRPEEDGTYSERTKYGLISVVIHEVGHNWFPMIINSDERQWTWMDEGLNTYLQVLSEHRWEKDYPSRRGEPDSMTGYMRSAYSRPIMTNSESLLQFGNNAYAKPATALNILRETVLGRQTMDDSFRAYSTNWAFKRPQPADLFRILEDSSGTDLDWFFRGWFYTTGYVDFSVDNVTRTEIAREPTQRKGFEKAERDERTPPTLTEKRNEDIEYRVDRFPELVDFYTTFDELEVTPDDERGWRRFLDDLEDDEREAFEAEWLFYTVRIQNRGELVMPVPLLLVYEDGTEEDRLLPAEVWVTNNKVINKLLVTDKALAWVEIDRHRQIADSDRSNNRWPQEIETQLVTITTRPEKGNPLQQHLREIERVQGHEAIESFSSAMAKVWTEAQTAGATTPASVWERLLAIPEIQSARDPWNRPFVIELSDSTEAITEFDEGKRTLEEFEIAWVRSAGEDGEPDTPDDLSWRVFADGHVGP